MYIAPSVLNGSYGTEADVWSLGIVVYALLSGFPPFMGRNNEEVFEKVRNGQLDLETKRWKYISTEQRKSSPECFTKMTPRGGR